MPDIKWELRAQGSLTEIKDLLSSDEKDQILSIHATSSNTILSTVLTEPVLCAGNQHTCKPEIFVPASQKRYNCILMGSGDSKVVGYHLGPRALVWKQTTLTGEHPELGKLKVTLAPDQDHAGTIVPLQNNAAFPALNRNTYFFELEIEKVGVLISERPAIVEAIIDTIPPTATYEFKNAPLNFYLKGDANRTTVAVIERASTDVVPIQPGLVNR